MSTEKKIMVQYPGGTYPILIGKNLLKNKECLRALVPHKQIMIVSNGTVASHYLNEVESTFSDRYCEHFLLPDGETHKILQNIEKIWDALAEHHFHRDACLIALGGGVVGDMTGFAAACYQRGISFLQLPTTLLAQADASIGGKTGVDHPRGKNLIGAFHQPIAVVMDTETLNTLPDRTYRSGLSEIVKHALIKDAVFFDWMEANLTGLLSKDPETITEALYRSCHIKAAVVAADEKERTGERALLNFGHTFGHAIEQNLNYQQWQHGEAVALGMLMAAKLSQIQQRLTQAEYDRIANVLEQIQMPKKLPAKIKCDTLLAALWSDKKVMNNQLHFVVLNGIGEATLTSDVDEKTLLPLLSSYQ